ncbi:MAG: PKD domain-containing protein [Phycisphaerales bacterium]|nr:MAG: PKD domain-containing protein [Phycisphaerales bacterium]
MTMTRLVLGPHRLFRLCIIACIATVAASAGCSQYIDPNVPEPIRPFVEPELGREYLLYRPSHYDREHSWPLIVVCHSSFPDSPNKQLRAWTEFAESHGFLVAAPELKGIKKSFPPKAAEQIALQREDEACILATLQHVRAGHNISHDRVFLHGWAGGAYAALHTGLRHANLFRAVSLIQPRFKSGYLVDVDNAIDPYQPVYVNCSAADAFTGKHGRHFVEWAKSHGINLREDSVGSTRSTDTARVVNFYEHVIRKEPWIRIRALPTGGENPLELQFGLRCSYTPTQYLWEFGEGKESPVAQPIHVFDRPGTHRVAVTVKGPDNREDHRELTLQLP